jgi:hypothetical protein
VGFRKKHKKHQKGKVNNNITLWNDHIDKKYGPKGMDSRNKYDEGFEAFKIGVLLQEAQKNQNLTQKELAQKIIFQE